LSDAKLARKLRLPLGFLLAALYLVFARPTSRSLLAGGSIAFAGLLIRAWAAGHIQKGIRLAITGPYAHTRNPLYLGSFLIASGFALAANAWLLLPVCLFFLLIYRPTMRAERTYIGSLFPNEYRDWEAHVPPFLPRATPWRPTGATPAAFSPALYMRHGEWRAALGFAATMVWLSLRVHFGF
jgi:protein-S-isoprenylcysteine O-methyltransferase Ste14